MVVPIRRIWEPAVLLERNESDPSKGWWVLGYDASGRMTSEADPDNASIPGCGKAGVPGKTIVTSLTYYLNGQIATKQTSAQSAGGVMSQYTYDADNDMVQQTSHNGCIAPVPPGTPPPCAPGYTLSPRGRPNF
jgi:hypothetical protein